MAKIKQNSHPKKSLAYLCKKNSVERFPLFGTFAKFYGPSFSQCFPASAWRCGWILCALFENVE